MYMSDNEIEKNSVVEQQLIKALYGYNDDGITAEAMGNKNGDGEEEKDAIAENEPAIIQDPELTKGSSCLSCAHYMTNIQICHKHHRKITRPEETNCNHEQYEEGSCKVHNELVLEASIGFNIRS